MNVLRKYALALLAAPVLITVYLGSLLRASGLARTGVAIGLGAVVGLGAIGLARPTDTTATPPSDLVPLTQAAFRTTIGTGVEVDSPATIGFSTPMDRASVQAALSVTPATDVSLIWADDDMAVSVLPVDHWAPGTYHTLTVEAGALAASGRPLTTPARASFLTREPSIAVVGATDQVGKRVAADTSFTVAFDQPVDESSLAGAIRLDPPAEGTITVQDGMDGVTRVVFTPAEPLEPGETYQLVVDGVQDADGLPVDTAGLAVKTVKAPAVVRFRPLAKSTKVERDQTISVRFTQSMDRASTKRAFEVTADGKAVDGKISFAEDDKVLIFDPTKRLPYDVKVVATVATSALSQDGAALAESGRAAFTTVAKPKPAEPRASSSGSGGSSSGGSGGGSVGSGSWASVERYYLGLMNCTRTGGWVDSGGNCDSPGGRDVAALKLSAGISSKVARPYAKLLATRGQCSHFIGGNPGDRLERAGYDSYRWAENIGCRSGSAKGAVLGSHRYFQSEKSYNGGHYVNMMSAKYSHVGIGVWVASGRVRLVVDFYHP
jgi:uncharacterized protein YkwD